MSLLTRGTQEMKEIEERRSIRKYTDKKVPQEMINALIESGMQAPSGDNSQPWHFILVDYEEMKRNIVNASNNQKWMMTAPLFIVCVADIRSRIDSNRDIDMDEETSLPELKLIIRDTAIAIEHIVLEAVHLGLGTCWVAWFDQKSIRPLLGIPADKYVVCVLTVGFPAEKPAKRKRKTKDEVMHYNKW